MPRQVRNPCSGCGRLASTALIKPSVFGPILPAQRGNRSGVHTGKASRDCLTWREFLKLASARAKYLARCVRLRAAGCRAGAGKSLSLRKGLRKQLARLADAEMTMLCARPVTLERYAIKTMRVVKQHHTDGKHGEERPG